jgi:hypothetical protein
MAKIMNKTHDRLGLRPRCHSVVSIRDDTGTEIARRQSHNRETATQGRGRNLPRESTHPPQLGVSSAYNPGAFNTSLPITINGHATSALVDSGATDNFVRLRILSAGTPIRRQPDNYVLLAGEGKEMEIVGAYNLHFEVADLSLDTSFLVSPGLRFDVVLGRRWLKEYQVIHDHNIDCLYLGRELRK